MRILIFSELADLIHPVPDAKQSLGRELAQQSIIVMESIRSMGELRVPRQGWVSLSEVPLGHVPGRSWSQTKLFEIEFDDNPISFSSSKFHGINIKVLSHPQKYQALLLCLKKRF